MRILLAVCCCAVCAGTAKRHIPSPVITGCTRSTPPAQTPFDSLAPWSLVGDFWVRAMNTVPKTWDADPWQLRVTLQPSGRSRPARPFVDPHSRAMLQGRVRFQPDDSTDIVLLGSTLDVGPIGVVDAGRRFLLVEALTEDGFRGQWRYAGGLAVVVDSATGIPSPDPGGYFCATRVPPSAIGRP